MSLKLPRPKLTKIRRLRGLDDDLPEPKELPDLPDMGAAAALVDLVDPEIRELAALLGDEDLAKRCHNLLQQHALGSIPEMICLDWLQRRSIIHVYQGSLFGGRETRGGAVPDFIIPRGGAAIVWRIQGYHHTLPGVRDRDLVQRLKMLGSFFDGLEITAVVDLWEDDLYDKDTRPRALDWAYAGVQTSSKRTES